MKAMILFFLVSVTFNFAFEFPKEWKTWKSTDTTLTKIGALPDCDADVDSLPEIYQETVFTYCEVKEGGPGKVGVLVNKTHQEAFSKRSGTYKDGAAFILHLKDLKVLFTTGYKDNAPVYKVFTEDGKDITAKSGPLAANTCITCHTGYRNFCKNGQCGAIAK